MSTGAYENLERELKNLYSQVPPPAGELAPGRERMLAEAARLKAEVTRSPAATARTPQIERPERRRRMNPLFAYKILAAVLAIVVAFTGAGGGVALAGDSLPGDLLYPVKIVTEEVRLLMTTDPADHAELAMTFATERVREMERLSNQGQAVPDSTVARLTRLMEQSMNQIALSRPDEVTPLWQRVRERARTQQQILERVRTRAPEESQDALRRASRVMERAMESAGAALGEPQRLREEHQYRYEGTPGPHGESSPPLRQELQQIRQEYQHRYEGTPGPHGQASPSPGNEPQHLQEQNQYQYQGTPGPHGQASPSPEPQQNQEQHQYRHEGTSGQQGQGPSGPNDDSGPHGGESGSGDDTTGPSDSGNQGGGSGKGN